MMLMRRASRLPTDWAEQRQAARISLKKLVVRRRLSGDTAGRRTLW
jgi:hypothetical protein